MPRNVASLGRRALWIPVFLGLFFLLPTVDAPTAARVLRSTAVEKDGLFGEWNRALADRLDPVVSASQRWRSFFEGESALPAPPDVQVRVPLREVVDRSGASPTWTLDTVLVRLKRVEGFGYLEFAEDPNGYTLTLTVTEREPGGRVASGGDLEVTLHRDGEPLESVPLQALDPDLARRLAESGDSSEITLPASASVSIPTCWSVLPPLVAILSALILRSAIFSLLLGVAAGAWLLFGASALPGVGGGGSAVGAAGGLLQLLTEPVTDSFKLLIVVFVLFLVGMIGVITRCGGTQGLVDLLVRRSAGARSSRIVTALMGLIVFFDDYSNTVVVGSSMRPVTDRFRVSREKLAYLIDSTAAPVAGIALFSTWIGYEVAQYKSALQAIGSERSPYFVFIETIQFRYYCIFTLFFVFANVFLSRDYGPMWRAESRAARTGQVIADGAQPLSGRRLAGLEMHGQAKPNAMRALVPIIVVILFMVLGFLFVGGAIPTLAAGISDSEETVGQVIGDILNNDYNMHVAALAAILGSIVAFVLAFPVIGAIDSARAWAVGFLGLFMAVGVLVTAWALASSCTQLGTGSYLVTILGESMPIWIQPVVFFGLACVVAFATGTSWGTMAILLPITIPIVHSSAIAQGLDPFGVCTLLAFGAVLEGAIFGDHCSPISDTTVLSSVSAGSDHIDHVRTQIPYALTTMLIAMGVGYLPVALGLYSSGVALVVGAIVCVAAVRFLGRPVDAGPEPDGSVESAGPEAT